MTRAADSRFMYLVLLVHRISAITCEETRSGSDYSPTLQLLHLRHITSLTSPGEPPMTNPHFLDARKIDAEHWKV